MRQLRFLYRRFTEQIAADAARVVTGHPRRDAFAWLNGDWIWCGKPVHFSPAGFGVARKPSGDPFLIHNTVADMWVLVLSDPAAFGVLIGLEMKNGTATFSGDVTVGGKSVRLRQIWRQTSDSTVEISNQRFDGRQWEVWSTDLLQRIKLPN